MDKKSYKTYENILIYEISYKTIMGAKPLHIWFNKINQFIKNYDGIRYSVLFGSVVLIIILQESELVHLILYLSKNV